MALYLLHRVDSSRLTAQLTMVQQSPFALSALFFFFFSQTDS